MIPIKLTLKNFMTYRELELDFSNIDLACICGNNGAGKSSILDAITWCLWEQARTHQKDNLIRLGSDEMYGELVFNVEDNIYKVIRKTRKNKKTSESNLEFQILSDKGYKSLTCKGIKETQNKIIEVVKMDYNTFINSVFILQGKADEFTTKKPKERKEILASMLNLENYDILNEKAKETKKEFIIQKSYLENDIKNLENDIKEETDLLLYLENLNLNRNKIINSINLKENQIIEKRNIKNNISNKISQLETIKNQHCKNINLLKDKEKELENIQHKIDYNINILASKEKIEKEYNTFINLKRQENIILENKKKFLELIKIKNETEIKIKNEKNILENEIKLLNSNIENLKNDLYEKEKLLQEKEKTLICYKKYKKSKNEEEIYQSKIIKFHELSEIRNNIEKNINNISIEFEKKITEKKTKIDEINKILCNEDKIRNEVLKLQEIENNINNLSQLLKHKEEKGLSYKSNKENFIKTKEQNIQKIKDLKIKIDILEKEESHNCPMCNKSLDDNDKKFLIERYHNEIELLEEEIKKLELEISNQDKLIILLRNEWSEINNQLKNRNQEKIIYEAKKIELQKILDKKNELVSLEDNLNKLINDKISSINELEKKLNLVKEEIDNLDFSQEKYSMIQAEIKNWEWTENKLRQINEAEKEIILIKNNLLNLNTKLEHLNKKILNNDFAIEQKNYLDKIQKQILDLNYDEKGHENNTKTNKRIE
ncbi:MAG: hypothetical protein KatS3mg068_1809 [Candidatus Sericytochromatia bacterium]|nr:MAG: hypothetical protein KatS3mg068_1809 [Candidatus Sericytochromatia bacterium]